MILIIFEPEPVFRVILIIFGSETGNTGLRQFSDFFLLLRRRWHCCCCCCCCRRRHRRRCCCCRCFCCCCCCCFLLCLYFVTNTHIFIQQLRYPRGVLQFIAGTYTLCFKRGELPYAPTYGDVPPLKGVLLRTCVLSGYTFPPIFLVCFSTS